MNHFIEMKVLEDEMFTVLSETVITAIILDALICENTIVKSFVYYSFLASECR